MYNPNFTDPTSTLLANRLARVLPIIRSLNEPTLEDYQAEIFTLINKIVNNGYNAVPIQYIAGQTPATIGNFTNIITALDQDATDIINEILDIENSVSVTYNLAAAANNTLRQEIRRAINASTQNLFLETFIDSSQIGSADGTVDYKSGSYSPNVTATTVLNPNISTGVNSIGTGDLSTLNSSDPTVYLSWQGNTLELVFTFAKSTPVNRLVINQYDYKDISITSLTSTPDGSVVQDILAELDVDYIDCGVTANKSLGDTTVDFNPKNCLALRLTLVDNTNSGSINLNNVNLVQQTFNSSSILVSEQIFAPIGTIKFNAATIFQEPYSILSHYISYDSTSYQGIVPGQIITIPSGTTSYYYKCVMSRNESLISQSGSFTGNGIDPSSSSYYSLQTITTNPLGNNIIEKNLLFNNIAGPVVIDDAVIPNTFYIQLGSTILSSTNYSFINGVLNLNSTTSNVTIVYQTNADVSSVSSLLNYFAPRLVSYSFEVV